MLRIIDIIKSIRIEMNAFNLVISACLNQEYEGKYYSIIYYFKKLFSTKQNYDIANKKLLIIVVALQYWRIYAKKYFELDIYTNCKNLLNFIITKELNRRQIKWFKLLRGYKFRIHYTSRKENDRVNALSRKCDYMKIKKIFDKSILQINKNGTLSSNHKEVTTTMRIIKDDEKQFSMKKGKLWILKNKIDEYIKKHHDESLQRHSRMSKIMQLLRKNCQFSYIRQRVEAYIRKCLNY